MEMVAELDEAIETGQAGVEMGLHPSPGRGVQGACRKFPEEGQPETLTRGKIGLSVQVFQQALGQSIEAIQCSSPFLDFV